MASKNRISYVDGPKEANCPKYNVSLVNVKMFCVDLCLSTIFCCKCLGRNEKPNFDCNLVPKGWNT